MADLDRWDLDGSYIGECPICGGPMYDDGELATVAGELVHKACNDEIEEEMMGTYMEWRQE